MNETTKLWLKGLMAAAISALSTAVSGVVVLPQVFNFSHDGMLNTVKLITVPTVVAVCTYLKKSPMPDAITATVDQSGNITDVSGTVEVGLQPKK